MMTLEERLNARINELEAQLKQHQEKEEKAKYSNAWEWRHSRILTDEEND